VVPSDDRGAAWGPAGHSQERARKRPLNERRDPGLSVPASLREISDILVERSRHSECRPEESVRSAVWGPAMTRETRSGCARQFDRGMAGTSPS